MSALPSPTSGSAFTDFVFDPSEKLDSLGGPKQRYLSNVAAIKLLKQLEAECRPPGNLTTDEQQVLARYCGWGDTEVFNHSCIRKSHYEIEHCGNLKGLLTEPEIASLRASTLNSHYTKLDAIRAIYEAIERLGLAAWRKLRILEPAAGIGHFLGAMPAALANGAERVAIELDSVTARILARLYPTTRVFESGFEAVRLPNHYFDLIISNIPFANVPVHDPETKDRRLRECVHDYFFVKSLSLLKPGGVLAFITSRYTLDKQKNVVRRYLARHAELLAAVRLPSGAFKQNAGTEVITDVILLRKRASPIDLDSSALPVWAEIGKQRLEDEDGYQAELPVNMLFISKPDLVLGKPKLDRGMYGRDELVIDPGADDLAATLRDKLVAQLPATPLLPPEKVSRALTTVGITPPVPNQTTSPGPMVGKAKSKDMRFKASALFELYLQAKKIIRLQLEDTDDQILAEAQAELHRLYDRFRMRSGPINSPGGTRGLDQRNPILPFLRALEESDGQGGYRKTPFFDKRTIRPSRRTGPVSDPKEALLRCLDELGRIDIDYIGNACGVTPEAAAAALTGIIYEMPGGGYVTADEYLSGNVRLKLREAEAAAQLHSRFEANVTALKAVLPTPLEPREITARLGSGWIPADVIASFIRHLLPTYKGKALYHEQLAAWSVEPPDAETLRSIEATQTWGTIRRHAVQIIDDGLNLREPTVHETVIVKGQMRSIVNTGETTSAQAKLAEIKLAFDRWIWADPQRAERLATIYNDRYNCLRARRYDGSHLQFPGMNCDFKPRQHQMDGAWRILQNRATLLGHCVGSGKTALSIIAAHELKRLGLARKALVAVPNHLLVMQWQHEALRIYPDLKILALGKAELKRNHRGELMSRIATGDWDLVLVPHSSFTLLPVRQGTSARFIKRELTQLRAYIDELESRGDDDITRRSVKEIERAIQRLETKLKNASSEKARDSEATICWEELGVDLLVVDEAHYFKNLYCPTKMTRVSGMPNSESQRAFDMFMKVRTVLEGGGRVVFATGTPISNSIAECFVMMKYLQLETLEEMGLAHFDAWAQMFADTCQSVEMKPDGSGFRVHTRFARFTNLPELMAIWGQALDVKTAEQLHLPRPRIHGVGPEIIKSPKSPSLDRIIKSLARRADLITQHKVSPEVDNMLVITTEGRKAALDPRLVDPSAPADPEGKISRIVESLVRYYHESQDTSGVQVLYIDTNCPRGKTA
jgi:N12 class adenine-specific DNA methylase